MRQDRTTGQGSREGAQSAPEPKAGQSQRHPDSGQAQRERSRKDLKDQTTGQGSRDNTQPSRESQSPSQSQQQPSQSQPQRQQTQTPNDPKSGQTGAATQSQSGTSAQGQASGTTLNSQQQASIQQSVLSARNAPRVSSVNFAVSAGTVVPRNVNAVRVSSFPILIETFPRFRDFSFFVIEDEIVFLDTDRRIVEVVPAGPRRFSGGGGTSTSTEVLQLSEPEIREVQLVLVQRGLLVQSEVTGVLSPRTKEALITFQRQQGLQTSGSIDVRTVSSLGLSSKVGPQRSGAAGSSPTTGSGSSTGSSGTQQPSQQPSGQQGQSGTQQPSAQPNTSGQGSGQSNTQGQNQPATGQQQPNATSQSQSGQNNSSTTGQGNAQQPAQNPQNQPNQNRQNSNPGNSAPAR